MMTPGCHGYAMAAAMLAVLSLGSIVPSVHGFVTPSRGGNGGGGFGMPRTVVKRIIGPFRAWNDVDPETRARRIAEAEQGLLDGWRADIDRSTGHLYYYNFLSGETKWEKPARPKITLAKAAPILNQMENRELGIIDPSTVDPGETEISWIDVNRLVLEDDNSGSDIDNYVYENDFNRNRNGDNNGEGEDIHTGGLSAGRDSRQRKRGHVKGWNTSSWNRSDVAMSEELRAQTEKDLLEGWRADIDRESGQVYYYNFATGEARWDKPTRAKINLSTDATLFSREERSQIGIVNAGTLDAKPTKISWIDTSRLLVDEDLGSDGRISESHLSYEQARLESERIRLEEERRRADVLQNEEIREQKERLARERAQLEQERIIQEQQAEEEIRRQKARMEREREKMVERLRQEEALLEEEKRRLEQERIEQQRFEEEQLRLEQQRYEQERLAEEQLRLQAERQEQERREQEQRRIEAERLEQQRMEQQRIEREERRIEQERIERELELERRRQEELRLEQERVEQERQEQERIRLAQERQEAERLEKERFELLREEAQRLEQERLEVERLRIEAERVEKERLEEEQRRIEREREEQRRIEAERVRIEKERIMREEEEFQKSLRAEESRIEQELMKLQEERRRLTDERMRLRQGRNSNDGGSVGDNRRVEDRFRGDRVLPDRRRSSTQEFPSMPSSSSSSFSSSRSSRNSYNSNNKSRYPAAYKSTIDRNSTDSVSYSSSGSVDYRDDKSSSRVGLTPPTSLTSSASSRTRRRVDESGMDIDPVKPNRQYPFSYWDRTDTHTQYSMKVQTEKDLLDGWRSEVDPASGETYYYNFATGQTTWYRPEKSKVELATDSPILELDELEETSVMNAGTLDARPTQIRWIDVNRLMIRGEEIDNRPPEGNLVMEPGHSRESRALRAPSGVYKGWRGWTGVAGNSVGERQGVQSSAETLDIQTENDLRDGWRSDVDPATGRVYYYNFASGEASWEKPLMQLPASQQQQSSFPQQPMSQERRDPVYIRNSNSRESGYSQSP